MANANSQMVAGRFLRWHKARKRIAWIISQLEAGRTVYLATALRVTKVTAKHKDMFKATRTGSFIQRGKAWDCIDGCQITAGG